MTTPSANQTRNIPLLCWLIGTQAIFLLHLLPWFFIAGMSVMAFDAPGSEKMAMPWVFAGSVWLYPVIPGICAILAWIYYGARRPFAAAVLSGITLLFVIGAYVIAAVFGLLVQNDNI